MKARLVTPLVATLLAGCGGGIYLELGPDDDPPAVSLAVGSDSAAPGQAVHLAAAASDDDVVDEVKFYRLEAQGGQSYLGRDVDPPYEWNATMPDVATGTPVSYFARAIDSAGQVTDSDTVTVTAQ